MWYLIGFLILGVLAFILAIEYDCEEIDPEDEDF